MFVLFQIKAGAPLKIVGQPLNYGPAAVAVEPGDPELAALIEKTINSMRDDGTLSALSIKWFGVDLSRKL